MATFFQSFRSSAMPKRLVRYALSRLDLLDTETLDMDNLDLAIGKKTVFEFRDVRIKLKKLEKLLQLPSSFKLDRARILLLRVTIPMDFYTSPIIVEVDGVDVRLQVISLSQEHAPSVEEQTPALDGVVPNTADLAQSFLGTQSPKERRELEEALAAETQNLGASLSVTSDDGCEDESHFGTGQALSLPAFMADFLQGVVDRVQVRIKDVMFQLDLDVLLEVHSTTPEPVSVQISLDTIDVEGVTTTVDEEGATSFVPKEGKRHIGLNQVRACLITETNVFSYLAQSASPSMASSPTMTRNPPSREFTMQETEDVSGNLATSTQSLASTGQSSCPEDALSLASHLMADSEDALSIPYDLHEPETEQDEISSPPTPRASVYHESDHHEQSLYHSTSLSDQAASQLCGNFDDDQEQPIWQSIEQSGIESPFDRALRTNSGLSGLLDDSPQNPTEPLNSCQRRSSSPPARSVSPAEDEEDLVHSRLFTHEEAQSMYLSAFSATSQPEPISSQDMKPAHESSAQQDVPHPVHPSVEAKARPSSPADIPELRETPSEEEAHNEREEPVSEVQPVAEESEPKGSPKAEPTMPGAWGDDSYYDEPSITLPVSLGDSTSNPHHESSMRDYGEAKDMASSQRTARDTDRPDDTSTPKGPTRLVKEVVRLEKVSLYVPTQHSHIQVHPVSADSVAHLSQTLDQSLFPQAPGAFSMHAPPRDSPKHQPQADSGESFKDDYLDISLSPVTVSFDASLGFLLAMVLKNLVNAVKVEHGRKEKTGTPSTDSGGPSHVRLTLERLSVDFLNQLTGVADTSERHLEPPGLSFGQEVLLNATIEHLTLSMTPKEIKPRGKTPDKLKALEIQLDMQKFRFGYANDDIIWFDSGRPLSTSVRDSFLGSGHDIGIKIFQAAGESRTDVETLPLAINVDLQRLDETFSWFGGLSSFLNMSASMTSSPAPTKPATQKARGVHFSTPLDPEDKSAVSENKISVRVGGATVEVTGRDCSLAAESTAIKIIHRSEGLGLAISKLRMSGPYLRSSMADPPITTDIGGVRVDFLNTPGNADLDRLLELIVPSKSKFDQNNDELMLDTLLKQRRKGSVLKLKIETVQARVSSIAQLSVLPTMVEDIKKLATVAKYFPEDDRPGLLTLATVEKISADVRFDGKYGSFAGEIRDLGVAAITVPSLVAVATQDIRILRNKVEELVNTLKHEVGPVAERDPVIMARMIGDEIEPVVKLKLQDIGIEYRVNTIMDILGLGPDTTPQDFEETLAASIADLGEHAHSALLGQFAPPSEPARAQTKESKPLTVDIEFRDCVLGLNPHKLPAKMAVVLMDSRLIATLPKDEETHAELHINKASLLLIDDVETGIHRRQGVNASQGSSSSASRQVTELCSRGYVEVCFTSSAQVSLDTVMGQDGNREMEVTIRDNLLVLETCADSTQTLIAVANALKPPTPPAKANQYRTKVIPVQDLLASISAEAFGRPEGEYDFDQDFAGAQEMAGSGSEPDSGSQASLRVDSQYYNHETAGEELFDATKTSGISEWPSMHDTQEGVLLGFTPSGAAEADSHSELEFHDDFYASDSKANQVQVAKIWNSARNTYDEAPRSLVSRCPLRVSVRDVHFIWNLFDGYDWERTRDVISKAVEEVEAKAMERQNHGPAIYEEELEDEEAIGDLLFNSIYIGIPANHDPRELSKAINAGLHDNATETESVAPTTITASTNRTARPSRTRSKRLRLGRSKRHKITFELAGVDVDLLAFPPDAGETVSSIDVRVDKLDVFDHVPTSTWRKFATYDQDMGEREMGSSMAHIELLNVKPLPELGASELVIRVTILPLRLHVDQDALDFITRFFEFKDDKTPAHASQSDVPFVQRVEVNDVPVKLDFKPKRVDYAGLRSGHTTEFMNFIVLEEARMVLRHVIIYGVSGFDRLGKTLNDIWTPDVRNNQLPGVIAGLAPVRSLVNIGSGFKDLVEIPLREYQRDGRVFRSISKGAFAFARKTGTEVVKLGAKLAVGTQYALQGAEGLLADAPSSSSAAQATGWDDDEELDEEEKKQISLYADQPTGVIQGIRGGYRSLARDMNTARDAIIAVPGEVMASAGPGGAAKAVWRKAPTIIFRPAMGMTKVIGQTLLGATNSMDPEQRRRIDEKYKKH